MPSPQGKILNSEIFPMKKVMVETLSHFSLRTIRKRRNLRKLSLRKELAPRYNYQLWTGIMPEDGTI